MPVIAKPEWFLPPHMCQPDRSAAMRKMRMTWMIWTISPKNRENLMVAYTQIKLQLFLIDLISTWTPTTIFLTAQIQELFITSKNYCEFNVKQTFSQVLVLQHVSPTYMQVLRILRSSMATVSVSVRRRKLHPTRRHPPPTWTSTSLCLERKVPPASSRCVTDPLSAPCLPHYQQLIEPWVFRADARYVLLLSPTEVCLCAGVRRLGKLQSEWHARGVRHPLCQSGSQRSGRWEVRTGQNALVWSAVVAKKPILNLEKWGLALLRKLPWGKREACEQGCWLGSSRGSERCGEMTQQKCPWCIRALKFQPLGWRCSHCNHTFFTKLNNHIKIHQNNTLRLSSQCTHSFTPRVDPRVIFPSRLDWATSGLSKILSCEHSFPLLIHVQQVAIMRPPNGLNAPPRKAIKKKSQQSAVFCHL